MKLEGREESWMLGEYCTVLIQISLSDLKMPVPQPCPA